jgi:hypothetical protein
MALPEILRNDDIEGFSYGFRFRTTKNSLGTCVPEGNYTLRIRVDNGVGRITHECSIEPLNIRGHGVASW